MRCRTCDYALWNLRTRDCPECGTRFSPAEFEFKRNAVAFLCPHCEQTYYGTDEKGHLVPDNFECVTCGERIHLDEMIVRPAQDVDERDTMLEYVPWEERSRYGAFKGFWKTVWMGMIMPHRLMHALPLSSGSSNAWGFLLVVNVLVFVGIVVPYVLLFSVMGIIMAGAGAGMPRALGPCFGSLAVAALAYIIACVIGVAIWGLVAHGILRVTGSTSGTIGRTFQAIGYGSAGNLASIVPCIGTYFGWIWWVVSATIALCVGQKVSVWRGILAGAGFPVLIVILAVGGYFGIMATAFTTAGSMAAMSRTPLATGSAEQRTEALATAVRQHYYRHLALPDHALHLAAERMIDPTGLALSETNTDFQRIRIGDVSIGDLHILPQSRQRGVASSAADTLPDDVIAHRTGDFVFIYHGMSMAPAQWRLWVVIASPDPDHNTARDVGGTVYVGLADGSVEVIPATAFESQLKEQNRARETHGLAPIPPPWVITHAQPARESPN